MKRVYAIKFVCLLLVLALVGCGNSYRIDGIPIAFTKAIVNGEQLTTINTDKPIDEIASALENLNSETTSYNVERYSEKSLLLTIDNPMAEKSVLFVIEQDINNPKFQFGHSYAFFSVSKTVITEDGEYLCEVAWPYHLIDYSSDTNDLSSNYNAVSFDTPYPTKYGLTEFQQFYQMLAEAYPQNHFDTVSVDDSTIILPHTFVRFFDQDESVSGSIALALELIEDNQQIVLKKHKGEFDYEKQ